MRTPKKAAPETFEFNPNLKNDKEIIRETREYELITPLFGGGAETKKADEISVVRATEVRGHLRFWWRATRGGQFSTIEDLKKHEDAIFGSTEINSALQIEVEIKNRGADFPDFRDNKNQLHGINSQKSPFSYVAFPLRDEQGAKVIKNIVFELKFAYPKDFQEDIQTSVWAWEMFGGIGARTRRGFGAIQNRKYLPDSQNLSKEIERELNKILPQIKGSGSFPVLSRDFRVTTKKRDSESAWKYLFGQLKNFRQYRKDEFGNPLPFGSSQWSEPNALRYRVGIRNNKPEIDKFPRAEFGLPILFEMKHDRFKTTLKGKGKKAGEFIERLSSPLILRPIKCSDGAVGIALILDTPRTPPNGLVLTEVKRNDEVSAELTPQEAKELTEKLEPLKGETDVLQAFLNYLEK